MTNKERLNSNIYKNIFPEDVIDLEYLERLKQSTVSSYNEIIYPDHGLEVHDVVLKHEWTELLYNYEKWLDLTNVSLSLSYANNKYLNTSTKRETVRITIVGGNSRTDHAVTKTLTVTGAYSLTKISENVYDAIYISPGTYTATIECKCANPAIPTVRNVQTITILNSNGTSTTTGSFVGAWLNSGWSNITPGSYIDTYSFSLQVRGHSGSGDKMYILGKTSNGTVYVIADLFNGSNRMKLESAATIGTGNLASNNNVLSGTLTLANDIRQICYMAYSNHTSCVPNSTISFNYTLCYNENLWNKDNGITSGASSKVVTWTIPGTNTEMSPMKPLPYEVYHCEYMKAIADPSIIRQNLRKEISTIVGIVTAVKSKDIFTVIDQGYLDWPHLDFDDTTVLYLSDKIPGKTCHYREIDNLTYIPIAIYTDNKIIINILDGATGAPLLPYKDVSYTQDFESYTQAELDTVEIAVWGAS